MLESRFEALPRRLEFALRRWSLDRARVLDVGCSYGHCLVHFGPGSVGVDNAPEHVEFCRALGLDARLADVDAGLEAVEDGAFDYAWVSDVLEHLDAPRLLLRRVLPKLALDGRLLLFLTVLPRSRLARAALGRRGLDPFAAAAHHYQFTFETARFLLERSGFRVSAVAVPPLSLDRGIAAFAARAHAPRLFFEARPDETRKRLADEAERRNKPSV